MCGEISRSAQALPSLATPQLHSSALCKKVSTILPGCSFPHTPGWIPGGAALLTHPTSATAIAVPADRAAPALVQEVLEGENCCLSLCSQVSLAPRVAALHSPKLEQGRNGSGPAPSRDNSTHVSGSSLLCVPALCPAPQGLQAHFAPIPHGPKSSVLHIPLENLGSAHAQPHCKEVSTVTHLDFEMGCCSVHQCYGGGASNLKRLRTVDLDPAKEQHPPLLQGLATPLSPPYDRQQHGKVPLIAHWEEAPAVCIREEAQFNLCLRPLPASTPSSSLTGTVLLSQLYSRTNRIQASKPHSLLLPPDSATSLEPRSA